MADFHTTDLHSLLVRIRAGEDPARDELIRFVIGRLEHLARKLLKGFPGVARWEQTDDVLSRSVMRLLHSLQTVTPETTRDFFNFAAVEIRRELLDLLRYHSRSKRPGSAGGISLDASTREGDALVAEPADQGPSCDELERWSLFHEAIGRLPAQEREVVMLRVYHSWSQEDIAELLGVDERTVRRYWRRAGERLVTELGPDLPLG